MTPGNGGQRDGEDQARPPGTLSSLCLFFFLPPNPEAILPELQRHWRGLCTGAGATPERWAPDGMTGITFTKHLLHPITYMCQLLHKGFYDLHFTDKKKKSQEKLTYLESHS